MLPSCRSVNPYVSDALQPQVGASAVVPRQPEAFPSLTQRAAAFCGVSAFAFQVCSACNVFMMLSCDVGEGLLKGINCLLARELRTCKAEWIVVA